MRITYRSDLVHTSKDSSGSIASNQQKFTPWTSTGQAELDARNAEPTNHAVLHVATCPCMKHDYTGQVVT